MDLTRNIITMPVSESYINDGMEDVLFVSGLFSSVLYTCENDHYCCEQQVCSFSLPCIPWCEHSLMFIHFIVDGYLSCFQFWAAVNNTSRITLVNLTGHTWHAFLLG